MRRLPRFWLYLLLSDDGRVYCGQTNCLKRRLKQHNAPDNEGWTRGRRWYLLGVRCFLDRHTALLAERLVKRSRYDKQNWIRREGRRLRILCRRHDIESPHT